MNIVTMCIREYGDWPRLKLFLKEQLGKLGSGFDYDVFIHDKHQLQLRCTNYPSDVTRAEVQRTFAHLLSTAISLYIVHEVEQEIIFRMVRSQHDNSSMKDIQTICEYCYQLLYLNEDETDVDELKRMQRRCKIYERVYPHLQNHTSFHLDGFIRFRLKDYQQELGTIIEYAIEEYNLEKEYREFLELLRYFLSKQTPKMDILHVLHVQERHVIFLDEDAKQLSNEDIQQYLASWSTKALHHEDVIISTLMAIAPQRLHIHTTQPDHNVVQTISSIFESRVTICTDCSKCAEWAVRYKMHHHSKV